MENKIWILIKTDRLHYYENTKIVQYIEQNKVNNIQVLDPDNIIIDVNEDEIRFFYSENNKLSALQIPDKVYIKVGMMLNDYQINLLNSLKKLDVRLINDVDALITSSDKFQTSLLLSENKIPFIKGVYVNAVNALSYIETLKEGDFPIIIKSKKGSLGLGVYKINNGCELKNIAEQIKLLDKNYEYIVQPFYKEGSDDYRVMVLGGEIKYIMQRHAKDGEIRANLEQGSTFEFIEVNDDVKKIVKQVYLVFGLNVMGIDLFRVGSHYLVCEVNSNPGYRGYDKLTNKDFTEVFVNYLIKC